MPPTFVGAEADIVLAEAAWSAAVACTGRQPDTPPVALIGRLLPSSPDRPGVAGVSRWQGEKAMIALSPDATPTVVAHEVAHAWVNRGPRALVEGRTEALTQCIKRVDPGRFRGLSSDATRDPNDRLDANRKWAFYLVILCGRGAECLSNFMARPQGWGGERLLAFEAAARQAIGGGVTLMA